MGPGFRMRRAVPQNQIGSGVDRCLPGGKFGLFQTVTAIRGTEKNPFRMTGLNSGPGGGAVSPTGFLYDRRPRCPCDLRRAVVTTIVDDANRGESQFAPALNGRGDSIRFVEGGNHHLGLEGKQRGAHKRWSGCGSGAESALFLG